MVQISWFWLLHQPDSALARWFHQRVELEGGRRKKPAIIALARKLLIALWKFAEHGVVIDGAAMEHAWSTRIESAGSDQTRLIQVDGPAPPMA